MPRLCCSQPEVCLGKAPCCVRVLAYLRACSATHAVMASCCVIKLPMTVKLWRWRRRTTHRPDACKCRIASLMLDMNLPLRMKQLHPIGFMKAHACNISFCSCPTAPLFANVACCTLQPFRHHNFMLVFFSPFTFHEQRFSYARTISRRGSSRR